MKTRQILYSFILVYLMIVINMFAEQPANWSLFPAQSSIKSSRSNQFDIGSIPLPFRNGYFDAIWLKGVQISTNGTGGGGTGDVTTAMMNAADAVVSNAAINYADGVSNNVNLQMNAKDTIISNYFNGLISIPKRFKASLYTNIPITATAKVFAMTNIVLAASSGSSYSNTMARWYPTTTNKIIEFTGSLDLPAVQNGGTVVLYLYKNGAIYSTLFAMRSGNNADTATTTWSFTETVNTSTSDYYEVWINTSATITTRGSRSNNWWSAHTE